MGWTSAWRLMDVEFGPRIQEASTLKEKAMAGTVNKVILVGNLGADPEIKYTQAGKKIANLSLATSESWKDQSGERREETEWHRVVMFKEALANLIEQFRDSGSVKKGSKLYVEGQLQTRKWQGNDGQDRYTTEVVIQGFNGEITFLDRRGGGGDFGGPSDSGGDPGWGGPDSGGSVGGDLNDEIPF